MDSFVYFNSQKTKSCEIFASCTGRSGGTSSGAIQMESSGSTSPQALQLGWLTDGPQETQCEACLGSDR